MTFSISAISGSGVLFGSVYPTDCPRIQSTSKLSTVSAAARRSSLVPWMMMTLRPASARTELALVAKPSRSLISVGAETWRDGITVIP